MGRPKDKYYWNRVTKEKNGELKCKRCGHQFKGGVSRIKAHVDGIAKQGVAICPVVTEGVHNDIPSSSNIPQEATNAMDSFEGEMAQKLNSNEVSKDLGKKKRLAASVADRISIDSPSESSDEESTSSSFQRRKRVRVEGRPIVISSGSLVSVAQYVADSIKSNEYEMEKMAVELKRTKAKLEEEKKAHKRTRSAAKEKEEKLRGECLKMEQCAGKEIEKMKDELEKKNVELYRMMLNYDEMKVKAELEKRKAPVESEDSDETLGSLWEPLWT